MRAKDFALEAKPLAPLEIPTPAQSTVEKSVKMANHIDKVLDQYEIKKSIIQQEIDRLKDQIESLKYGPPEGSTVTQKGRGWVGRDREGHPIGGGPVDEAFDQPYDMSWEKGEAGEDYDALVRLPDGSNLSIMFNEEGPGQYMVEFWRGAEQSVTGEGDAQRIFATVLAAIAKFIQQHQPQSIVFSAHKEDDPEQKSDSRSKLYNRLVQRYAGTIGYSYRSWDTGDSVQYELTRLKPGVAESRENFNGIDISLEIQKDDEYVDDEDYDNQVIYVTASSNGRELGHVLFAFDGEYLMPQDLEVEERFRGQGIAQTMYDYVKSKGYKIRRSGQQTDAGAGFWDKHKGQGQHVWEQGVVENFADGKVKGKSRPGRVKRAGASCNGSVTDLRQRAKNASGERAKMYHWCANMKSGRKK